MITLITGAPGTGKTAALVSLLRELNKDRAIYVNGIPDLKLDHIELEDPTDWINSVPDGSVIVIDEVQRIWRPRGPGAKVPPDIAALETHRHRGLDFYVITQSPRLVDSNVRGLTGRHIHLRDLGMIGRFWYEWPECADQCATTWKNAPIKKRYRLPKAVFGQYKSASMHIKPERSVPWMLFVMFAALVTVTFLAYKSYSLIMSKMHPEVAPPPPVMQTPAILNAQQNRTVTAEKPIKSGFNIVDFVPRYQHIPESAPAYDGIRVVSQMPQVVGGICRRGECTCFTQQGTKVDMPNEACKEIVDRPAFNPYGGVSASQPPARAG